MMLRGTPAQPNQARRTFNELRQNKINAAVAAAAAKKAAAAAERAAIINEVKQESSPFAQQNVDILRKYFDRIEAFDRANPELPTLFETVIDTYSNPQAGSNNRSYLPIHQVVLTGNPYIVKLFVDKLKSYYDTPALSPTLISKINAPYKVTSSGPQMSALELAKKTLAMETSVAKKTTLEKIICILEKAVIVKPKLMNLFSPRPRNCDATLAEVPTLIQQITTVPKQNTPKAPRLPLNSIPEGGYKYRSSRSSRSRSSRSKKRSYKAKKQ